MFKKYILNACSDWLSHIQNHGKMFPNPLEVLNGCRCHENDDYLNVYFYSVYYKSPLNDFWLGGQFIANYSLHAQLAFKQ